MKRTLIALALAALPGFAVAQPPAEGTTHTFVDPVYTGTVFCDTLEQVREIATAEKPDEIYRQYLYAKNERNEPVCLAIVPTGVVSEIEPLGVMQRDGRHFNAWAIKVEVGGVIAYGLYLEQFQMVIA